MTVMVKVVKRLGNKYWNGQVETIASLCEYQKKSRTSKKSKISKKSRTSSEMLLFHRQEFDTSSSKTDT